MLVSLTAEGRQLHRPPLSSHFLGCEVSLALATVPVLEQAQMFCAAEQQRLRKMEEVSASALRLYGIHVNNVCVYALFLCILEVI